MVTVLGIESTAHTFGVGIVNHKGEILGDSKEMYTTSHGGIIPIECRKHHEGVSDKVIEEALSQAKLSIENIDVIAFSQGPGLAPSLIAGKNKSIEIAKDLKKPIVGVNHLVSHLEIGKLLTKAKDPVFVFVSGANTQVIAYASGRYRIFGETLDTGMGNALDKFARALDLGFPGGPKIEQLAKKGKYIELPYVVKGMDLSFSGILTQAINLYKNKKASKEDLCFSLQEIYFSMLAEVTERALAHTEKKEVLLIGGVAANKRLVEMLDIMCKERGASFYYVPLKYSGDNGVQIAWTGLLQYNSNKNYYKNLKLKDVDIKPGWRTDDVEVVWTD